MGPRKHVEELRDPTWFIELLRQGFDHLVKVRGYTDEQFRKLENALNQLEPVPDELDDLLVKIDLVIRILDANPKRQRKMITKSSCGGSLHSLRS